MASVSDEGDSRKSAGPTNGCSAAPPVVLHDATPASPLQVASELRSFAVASAARTLGAVRALDAPVVIDAAIETAGGAAASVRSTFFDLEHAGAAAKAANSVAPARFMAALHARGIRESTPT